MAEPEKEKVLTAPPVIRRTRGGGLQLIVAGYPVDGVLAVNSVCNAEEGSYTNIVFHNSYVIFEVEKPETTELNS